MLNIGEGQLPTIVFNVGLRVLRRPRHSKAVTRHARKKAALPCAERWADAEGLRQGLQPKPMVFQWKVWPHCVNMEGFLFFKEPCVHFLVSSEALLVT